ncbi:amino acid ABC transporter substrate-binding protein [Paramagnetospirillum marisnigri]|uniref:Amino acid ABC transporter substrate-binding protein n=1 Tax=Paramagnetospirillum marisnigri TaxID=1285242 RepID=A0A178MF87_9PROT|nr:ABC transporter substrate-binding protein [Paramagnetospirillum marisnigri]OAN46725.1 amino acid ABC transporter substrate-binding protein [Paramagnetospirillum marisnigri]
MPKSLPGLCLHGLARAAFALLGLATLAPAAQARIELGAPAAEAEVTIGCMYPMSGRAAIYGKDSVAGIKLALADLKAGTLGPKPPKLRIIVEDDRSKAAYAVRIAEDFVRQDKAKFFCGMVSSGVAQAVSEVARTQKVIMVGTDHASSRLTMDALHRYYFRVSNDSWTSNAAGARYLAELQKETGWKRMAFIGPDYDYGHASWTDLRESLQLLGVAYDNVGEFWPKLYEPDYSAYISAIVETKPDIVVTALWGGDFVAFLRQAATTSFFESSRLANFDTGGNYEVMLALGSNPPPGLILSARHHNNWPETEGNRAFVTGFHASEGRYPTYAAAGAYSGIMAIASAVTASAPRHDVEAMVDALETLRLKLPKDPDGFTSYIDKSTHQIVQPMAIGKVVPNAAFPPAKVMLADWRVYAAEDLIPPPELVRRRRAVMGGKP